MRPSPEQEATYPVLIFSHGYEIGFFAQNTVQMEELASHGYVVFSVGHAYESSIVFDGEGNSIGTNKSRIGAFYKEGEETAELYAKTYYPPVMSKSRPPATGWRPPRLPTKVFKSGHKTHNL